MKRTLLLLLINLAFCALNGQTIIADFNDATDIKTIKDEQKITLYPNPATSKIKVRGLKNKKSYKIYNALGIVVVTGNVTVNGNINVNNFSKGVYFLQIDNKLTFPFIKS